MKDFISLLQPVRNEQTRVILLFLRRKFAEYVFLAARKLGMLEAEWAWIVTEQALDASNIPNGKLIIILTLFNENFKEMCFVKLIHKAFKRVVNKSLMDLVFSLEIQLDIILQCFLTTCRLLIMSSHITFTIIISFHRLLW